MLSRHARKNVAKIWHFFLAFRPSNFQEIWLQETSRKFSTDSTSHEKFFHHETLGAWGAKQSSLRAGGAGVGLRVFFGGVSGGSRPWGFQALGVPGPGSLGGRGWLVRSGRCWFTRGVRSGGGWFARGVRSGLCWFTRGFRSEDSLGIEFLCCSLFRRLIWLCFLVRSDDFREGLVVRSGVCSGGWPFARGIRSGDSLGRFARKIRSGDSLGRFARKIRSEDSLGEMGWFVWKILSGALLQRFFSLEEIVRNIPFVFEKGCFGKGSLKGFLLFVSSLRLSHATILATAWQSLTRSLQLHIERT